VYSFTPYGTGSRVDSRLVDISARDGYALVGAKRTGTHAQASEYYQVSSSTLTYLEIVIINIQISSIENMAKHQRKPP
jgi:hypothetical protein